MKTLSTFVITVALIVGLVGCSPAPTQYNLTISATEGGEITTPDEETSGYDAGTVVPLVAFPHTGYRFVNWTGDVDTIDDVNAASTTITMNENYSITANFVAQRVLTIESTGGGEVTSPGEGTFAYNEGMVVDLVAEAEEGYQFVEWNGDVGAIDNIDDATTTIIMKDDYDITANFAVEIWDWNDLDAVRNDLGGSYLLMDDLDSTTAGYAELASSTANQGKGWEPIGTDDPFTGSFNGQGYEIRDLFISRPEEDNVGLFGCVAEGVIESLGVVNAKVTGQDYVGGLVGQMIGHAGTMSDSYFTGSVTGEYNVGGLVGLYFGVAVSNSHYNYNEVLINRQNIITIGALFGEDFDQWLANDRFLDVNDRLSQEDGYYLINDVSDFKELLAFGQDDSLKFRLKDDLDLAGEPDFYVPYLAGEFDGNGHKISNLSLGCDLCFVSHLGLFGCVACGGQVTSVGAEDVETTTDESSHVGGLVGYNCGTVSNSYLTGRVSGSWATGGLVGQNTGTVSDSYFTGTVTGNHYVGGLVGVSWNTVSNSYSTGTVTGDTYVGGLVGDNVGTVTDSFWDTQTSEQAASPGGAGKTTAEMKTIATFSDAGWNIITVANPDIRNPSYIWNVVDGQTYPFLSWQPVS